MLLSQVMRDDKRQTRADRVQAAPATANASFDDVAMMPTTWLGWADIGRSSIMPGKLTSAPPHSPPLAFPANLDMSLIGHSSQRAGAMWHHLPLSSQGLGRGVDLHSTSLHDVMGIPAVGPFSVVVIVFMLSRMSLARFNVCCLVPEVRRPDFVHRVVVIVVTLNHTKILSIWWRFTGQRKPGIYINTHESPFVILS